VLADVEAGADEDAGADGDVLGEADGDGDMDGDGDTDGDGEEYDGDGDGDGDGEADGDRLGDADADGDRDVYTDGDGDALAGGDAPRDDDALALTEEGTLREATGEADTAGATRPPDADAVAEEVSPAGAGVGVGVCPVKAVTAKPAADATITPPMIHASTIGRRERRRGWFLPPGGGWRYAPPGGGVFPGDDGMLFEVAVCGSPAGARSRLSPPGTCAAAPAVVVCVASSANPGAASLPAGVAGVAAAAGAGPGPASRANARMIDSGSQFVAGWRAPTSASRPSALGRCRGSLARQRSISGRTSAGT
jgi:hypothetical protein